MDIVAKLRIGNQHHQAGRLLAAEEAYEEVLQHSPDHPDALHLSGLVAFQQGEPDSAVRLIERAVGQNPNHVGYLKNLCAVLLAAGSLDKAVKCIEHTLDLCPESAELWFELGNTRQKMGASDRAVEAYKTLLKARPDHAEAYHNLATALQGRGDYDEAVACYQKALALNPGFPQALYNMGNALREMGEIQRAMLAMQQALAIKPDYFDAQFNLAKMYRETGQTEAAIEAYTAILQMNPASDETYNNLGNLFFDLGQAQQARDLYTCAIKLNPNCADAHVNMSLALQDMGDLEGAMAYARKALTVCPGKAEAISGLVYQMRQACDWQELEALDDLLDEATRTALSEGRLPSEGPFLNLSRRADPAMNLAVAQSWSKDLVTRVQGVQAVHQAPERQAPVGGRAGDKITIGYLSNNFRDHPMAHLLCGLFGTHDRQRFRVHCYSYGRDDGSAYRAQIKEECDRFVDLAHVHDLDAAAAIRNDQVDILIDLTGYMKGHRMSICALRPAPLQVRYLGQAGTTGADFFDYLIADAIAVPPEQQTFYSENIVYMPYTYQINNRQQPVADIPRDRAAHGLPAGRFVFCAFSSHYKLDPVMFSSWMQILSTVEDSVLWLLPGSDIARQNMRQAATCSGIDPERLVFADRLSKAEHLGRLALADLALDTRIVGGAATTSDALWAGVPVVTLKGGHFASRMSASLLNAVGLPELVCDTMEDYVAMAVELAVDPSRRQGLREKLSRNRMTEPLFDTERAVHSFESALVQMWDTHRQGCPPRPFPVGEVQAQTNAIHAI